MTHAPCISLPSPTLPGRAMDAVHGLLLDEMARRQIQSTRDAPSIALAVQDVVKALFAAAATEQAHYAIAPGGEAATAILPIARAIDRIDATLAQARRDGLIGPDSLTLYRDRRRALFGALLEPTSGAEEQALRIIGLSPRDAA